MTTPTTGSETSPSQETMEFFIGITPASPNTKSTHWGARLRENYALGIAIETAIYLEGQNRWLGRRLEKAEIHIVLETRSRLRDDDNLTASCKGLIDCLRDHTPSERAKMIEQFKKGKKTRLVRLAIIKDDAPGSVRVTYDQETRTGRRGMRIRISEGWSPAPTSRYPDGSL